MSGHSGSTTVLALTTSSLPSTMTIVGGCTTARTMSDAAATW
jgi:hypothetical protein